MEGIRPTWNDPEMLKFLRRLFVLGVLVAIAVALYRKVSAGSPATWDSQLTTPPADGPNDPAGAAMPTATKPEPKKAAPEKAAPKQPASWVEPNGGSCPTSHPIKAKLSSGIFHSPGGRSYDRTNADRCYVDADAAVADGLRAAKR